MERSSKSKIYPQGDGLYLTEIYSSIQGESTLAGRPCTFVRLSGCPLRCTWCDTVYSYAKGKYHTIDDILSQIKDLQIPLVELTGGEPLAQDNSILLLRRLIEEGFQTMIETSGSFDLRLVPKETLIIMDLKCPDSKMSQHNLFENLSFLKPTDEIKFVIASRQDFEWACEIVIKYQLESLCTILFSAAFGLVKEDQLVAWILESKLQVRFNMQIHKHIWHPRKKGV